MPRKRVERAESVPERRKRLMRELLRLPQADLVIVLETVSAVAELREETIADFDKAARAPRAGVADEQPDPPPATPQRSQPGPRPVQRRRRRGATPPADAGVSYANLPPDAAAPETES